MIVKKKIIRSCITCHNLIYGYWPIALSSIKHMDPSVYVPTLAVEGEVEATKNATALIIKGGVKPIVVSFHSVIDELYKGEGRS
jgi:hypothetical protein